MTQVTVIFLARSGCCHYSAGMAGKQQSFFRSLLGVCVGIASIGVIAAEEPDNDAASANAAEVGKAVSFTLAPLHDRDYFKVKSPGAGTLRFRVTNELRQHKSLHPWWSEESGREFRGGKWDRRVAAGEVCVFAVRSSYYDFNEVTNDEVIEGVFEFTPEHSTSEPNDTAETAEVAEAGKAVSFTLMPLHDRDCFKVKSPGAGTLRFRVTNELRQHKSLHPWWVEAGGNEVRGGKWDRRVEAGGEYIFAVRSNYYDFNEVTNDEVIEGVFEFTPEHSPSEPNDTAETAEVVEVGKAVSFTLMPRHDRDYFKVKSPGAGTLRFRVTSQLQKHQGLHVWWGEAGGNEVRGGKWDRRVTSGEFCVFAVRSSYYDFNEVTNDEVIEGVFEFTPEHSPSEPNDTAETAEVVEVGKAVSFTLMPRHDRDYFKVKSPGEGTLRFRVTSQLQKHQGLHLWWGEEGGNEVRSGKWDRRVVAGVEYTAAVRSSYYDFNETTNDEVIEGVFEFVPDALPGEPNDTPEQAQEVEMGKPFEVVFMPRHDVDFFKVTAKQDGIVRLRRLDKTETHPGLHLGWAREDGSALEGSWDHRVLAARPQAFGLRSSYHSFNESASELPVTLMAEFVPEPDAPETGDMPENARAVEPGTPFTLALTPSYDRDWFRVTAPHEGRLELRFITQPPGWVAQSWQRPGSDEPLAEEKPKVAAGDTLLLGIQSRGWSSEQILQAVIQYSDGAREGPPQTRRWTFKMNRSPPAP